MSKSGFSIADLQSAAKKLNTVEEPSSSSSSSLTADSKGAKGENTEALQALEDLYNKYDGDLDLIFGELGADPSKAKKPHHRPKNAREFASKYLEGFYSLVEEGGSVDADAKSHHKS